MGQYFTNEDVQRRFAEPLGKLVDEFQELCARWHEARESGKIVRPDLLLNEITSEAAMATLRKFVREASGKLDDAIAGVYRYRDAERRRTTPAQK